MLNAAAVSSGVVTVVNKLSRAEEMVNATWSAPGQITVTKVGPGSAISAKQICQNITQSMTRPLQGSDLLNGNFQISLRKILAPLPPLLGVFAVVMCFAGTAAAQDDFLIPPTGSAASVGFFKDFNHPSGIAQWSLTYFEERLMPLIKSMPKVHDLARLMEDIFNSIQKDCAKSMHECCVKFWHIFEVVADDWQRIIIENNPGILNPPCDGSSHIVRKIGQHASTLLPYAAAPSGDGSSISPASSGWSIGAVDIFRYMFEFVLLVFVVYQLVRIVRTHRGKIEEKAGYFFSGLGDCISGLRRRCTSASPDGSEPSISMNPLLELEEGEAAYSNTVYSPETDKL